MGYLQEIDACKRSADEAKFLEEWLLKAIETKNKDVIKFCKENLYDRYLEEIINAEEFACIKDKKTEEIIKVFKEV